MGFRLTALDHVQLAMPTGEEDTAERFYVGALGFTRLPKPEPLASRGGCWFGAGEVQVHLGVEADFRPAKKAHPALRVAGLDDLATHLADGGIDVKWDAELPNVKRCFV